MSIRKIVGAVLYQNNIPSNVSHRIDRAVVKTRSKKPGYRKKEKEMREIPIRRNEEESFSSRTFDISLSRQRLNLRSFACETRSIENLVEVVRSIEEKNRCTRANDAVVCTISDLCQCRKKITGTCDHKIFIIPSQGKV